MVADVVHPDAGFLIDFARHRLLQRFADLDKAGQHRKRARGEATTAAQQAARVVAIAQVFDQHDDGGVDSGEGDARAVAVLAQPGVAAVVVAGGAAATPAVAMVFLPVAEATRAGQERAVAVVQHAVQLADVDKAAVVRQRQLRFVAVGEVDGKMGHTLAAQAEKNGFARFL